jgi:hypothetical protein
MSGWETIKALRLLEERVDALGLEIADACDSYGAKFNRETYGDRVALQPKGDSLPHYSRDAHIWVGTLEELQYWLNGVDWARGYDGILRLSDHKKRSKAEADERNRQLMATIKKSKLVQGTHPGMFQNDIAVEDDQEVPF